MPIDFERAQPLQPSVPYEIAGTPILDHAPAIATSALLTRAIIFGIGGALLGAIGDALFIGLTHINLGYLAIAVAYLVAKAMTFGSRGEGGRSYQVAAVILTYLSVALAHSGLLWWEVRHESGFFPWNAHNLFVLARYGLLYPYLHFQEAGFLALIGVFILFLGLRAAWRMTSGLPGAVHHPFSR